MGARRQPCSSCVSIRWIARVAAGLDVALVADLAQLEHDCGYSHGIRTAVLKGRGIECGAMQNPLPMPAAAQVVYVDRLTQAQAREHYPELEGEALVAPTVVGDLERLPVRTDGVDFCVANHLLEHSLDPIGALEELLRVVRPGGRLFVAVPASTRASCSHPARAPAGRSRSHARPKPGQSSTTASSRTARMPRWTPARSRSWRSLGRRVQWRFNFAKPRIARSCASRREERRGRVWPSRDARGGQPGHGEGMASSACCDTHPRMHSSCSSRVSSRIRSWFRSETVAARDTRLRLIDGLAPDASGGIMECGRRQATGRDLVVLAGDTLVTAGFVERLRAAAYGGDDSPGIVSPITNESRSFVSRLGEGAGDACIDRFAALVSGWSLGLRPELHAATALCAYVPAAVLRRVDGLDARRGTRQSAVDRLCARATRTRLPHPPGG